VKVQFGCSYLMPNKEPKKAGYSILSYAPYGSQIQCCKTNKLRPIEKIGLGMPNAYSMFIY
jgi:hypothetical protein